LAAGVLYDRCIGSRGKIGKIRKAFLWADVTRGARPCHAPIRTTCVSRSHASCCCCTALLHAEHAAIYTRRVAESRFMHTTTQRTCLALHRKRGAPRPDPVSRPDSPKSLCTRAAPKLWRERNPRSSHEAQRVVLGPVADDAHASWERLADSCGCAIWGGRTPGGVKSWVGQQWQPVRARTPAGAWHQGSIDLGWSCQWDEGSSSRSRGVCAVRRSICATLASASTAWATPTRQIRLVMAVQVARGGVELDLDILFTGVIRVR
jgi:hypothetical protein